MTESPQVSKRAKDALLRTPQRPLSAVVYCKPDRTAYYAPVSLAANALRRVVVALVLVLVVCESAASGQEFAAPTNRNYAIDLFFGRAVGSTRIVGMGGAATAMAEGSSGMLANPASPGVRETTSHDIWGVSWHFDAMTPVLGSDYDNNGIVTEDSSFTPSVTAGATLQYRDWGIGLTATSLVSENASVDDRSRRIRSQALVSQVALARQFLDGDIVIGAAARGVLLTVTDIQPDSKHRLLELAGGNIEVGAIWKPQGQSTRLGATLRAPVISDETNVEACDPLNCVGYVLPSKVNVPWQASVGIARRHGPSPWNRTATTRWVDEKALLWDVDLVITGITPRGAGLEAFGLGKLQPSGRKHSFSVRGGVDYEWIPGRLRIRGGSYFEPGRFRDPEGNDIPGRVHLTFGAELRVWQFGFWNQDYRLQISTTSDVAKKFGNSGISIGFWH